VFFSKGEFNDDFARHRSNRRMVGIPIILRVQKTPYRIMVQIPGEALRIKANVIYAEFKRGGELFSFMLGTPRTRVTMAAFFWTDPLFPSLYNP
jgi:hypothetical protein